MSSSAATHLLRSVSKGRVLLVDDDGDLREVISAGLELHGFEVVQAASAEAALDLIESSAFDLLLTDLGLIGIGGLDLASRVIERWSIPVVVLTGRASLEVAAAAVRAQLYDFIEKPVDLRHLALALERAIERSRMREGVKQLHDEVAVSTRFGEMIGESPGMRALQALIVKVAPGHVSVVITGETGTGKELVARALHVLSPRAGGPFVAINCAAMPPALLESELFGHTRGAFTDAVSAKRGLLVEANGGTILLDEIGDMPLDMQVKLLRALQERKVRPVGGNGEVAFDARIIAATHRELEQDVEAGRFREDLYYRINVVQLPVPPLRSRGHDILLLAQYFIERACERTGRNVRGISSSAAEKLLAYEWPGNVRELENCIERATTLTQFQEIRVDDLPAKTRRASCPTTVAVGPPEDLLSMDELEKHHLMVVLKAMDGNKSRAAKVLGFDRRTLYRKLERYGVPLE